MRVKEVGIRHTAVVSAGLVLVLVLVAGAAVGLQGDDFDDAEPIEEGETQGEIVDGESDFYQLEANDTDALDVSVTADSGDIELRVYDSNRDVIVSDDSFESAEREVTYKLPDTGTYFIEVAGDGEEVTTDYTVTLDVVTPEENDQFAPNDDFDSAADIPEGVSDATIWGGESDFYQLEANDTDALDVDVTADSGDIELRVYDSNRDVIVSDDSFERSERDVTYKLPDTGTYYIEVAGDGEQTTTDYTVDLNVVTPEENDQFAPNDDFDSAADLPEGSNDATIWGGESDFYQLEANDTDALDVSVTADSGDIELRVYDSNRDVIASADSFESAERDVTYKLPDTGTYYIEVEGDDEQTTTDYTVDLNVVTPDENDQFAPNDDFDSAADIPEGVSDATIWGGESDFYQLEANDTDALDVSVTADSGDIELRVYDSNRDVIVSADSFESAERDVTYKLPETGTYYIEVEGDDEQTTTDYTVNLNVVTPDENDQFAPNDDFDSAATITEQFSDATIWGGESDFFQVGLNGSDGLNVEVTAESADILLRVYDPDRSLVAEATSFSSTERQLTIEASEQGDYFVEVEGDGQQATTDYTLQSNQTDPNTPPTADAGPDQTVNEGNTVTLDATGSNDEDGDSLTYSWTQTGGPDVSLTDADTATPEFTAPEVDSETDLTFEVTVDDGQATATDTTTVTVVDAEAGGPPPITGDDPPQDLDGDGLYEDINGDGNVTLADVQVFFENRNSDEVQNNPASFNFDQEEPAAVSIRDVQALYLDFFS